MVYLTSFGGGVGVHYLKKSCVGIIGKTQVQIKERSSPKRTGLSPANHKVAEQSNLPVVWSFTFPRRSRIGHYVRNRWNLLYTGIDMFNEKAYKLWVIPICKSIEGVELYASPFFVQNFWGHPRNTFVKKGGMREREFRLLWVFPHGFAPFI